MKTGNKIFLILIACLLILGALSLAIGIMLGGSLNAVFSTLWESITSFVTIFVFRS